MRQRVVRPPSVGSVPEWFFRWRPRGSPLVPKLIAVAVAGVALLFLITSVQIRVIPPDKVSPRRASVILLGDDLQGRTLALKAQEGGPFPSRFDLSQWPGLAALEQLAMATTQFRPPAYEPKMEDLPRVHEVPPLPLAAQGERYFPPRPSRPAASPGQPSLLPRVPVLYPLSGITQDTLPATLPTFDYVVDAEMASGAPRFLLRLSTQGSVLECVALEKGGNPGEQALEKWLRRIPFTPAPRKANEWISLGVRFTNPPDHGADTE